MASNARPNQFRDYLPEVFRADEVNGVSFLSRFLQAFETLFEELRAEIEGTRDGGSGGIPDLFSPDLTPPPQFTNRPQPEFEYLNYLASWIALTLRREKDVSFNRAFFKAAIPLYPKRGTLPGIEALLRAWLKGELLEAQPSEPPLLILTDLTRPHTDVNAVFQLGVTATLGVDTVLGEGPPFLFVADLITDPTLPELRKPLGLDVFQRAARALLDAEKPAHTYYQLRVRAHTMQLAPERDEDKKPGEIYAQVGETTLLWDAPWVFDSDC
jgi:phage tail-like protein